MNYSISISSVIVYISFILITCDIFNLQIDSFHFRASQLFLPVLLFLIPKKDRLDQKYIYIIFLIILSIIPSILISYNKIKSLGYLFWIIYNFAFVFYFFYLVTKKNPSLVLFSYINIVRFYIIISFLIFLFTDNDRVSLLFYEPSFYTIFIIPFLAYYFYGMDNHRILDTILIVLFYSFTKSALFIVCILSMVIVLIIIKRNLIYLTSLAILLIFGYFLYNILLSLDLNDVNFNIVSKLFSFGGDFDSLLMRGGNRWPRFLQSIDFAISQPFIGVGIGSYEDFQLAVGGYDYDFMEKDLPIEDGGFGKPAVNIFLEMIVTGGFLFFCLFLYFIKSCFSTQIFKTNFRWFAVGVLFTIFSLQFESNFMRLYFWAFLGILLGLKDVVKNEIQ